MLLMMFSGFLIALCTTLYLVPLTVTAAKKLELVDRPDGKLKMHKQPTPYLGGLAVYIGFIVALCVIFPFENNMFLFLVGSTLLLFIGLIDDIVVMKPYQKFFGQIIATFCFLKAGCHLKELFFSSLSNLVISFFWILTVINAFNLVDIMDGLSVSLASMATLSFLLCALVFDCPVVALLLAIFLGALLGFFWYNKPTAHIYLGDAGSLFIGGFIATVPFMLPWGLYSTSGYIAPLIILGIPFLEIGSLIIIRTYKKIPFYKGSPDHFAIYLQKKFWKPAQVLAYVTSLNIFLLVVALAVILNLLTVLQISGLGFLFIVLWYGVLLVRPSKNMCILHN